MASDAVSVYGDPTRAGPIVVTCEHAGREIPEPWRLPAADLRWLATHWGYDIGIAEVARTVVEGTASVGVFAEFSRLLCDTNRPWGAQTAVRREVEGSVPLEINRDIDDAELALRREKLYDAYHDTVDRTIRQRRNIGGRPFWLLSLHSYTPEYLGERREFDAGVLFDDYEADARALAAMVGEVGFDVRLNEPYSGKGGLIYSVQRHGWENELPYLEIELRQDTITDPEDARAVGIRLVEVIKRFDETAFDRQ